jgi:hypothetical protein
VELPEVLEPLGGLGVCSDAVCLVDDEQVPCGALELGVLLIVGHGSLDADGGGVLDDGGDGLLLGDDQHLGGMKQPSGLECGQRLASPHGPA